VRRRELLATLLVSGCGRYGDFTLPAPPGPARNIRFTFTARTQPVLGRGAAGAFDSHDALNPSVVRRDGVLYNFYSGWDGATWRTGLATSRDGIDWQKHGVVLAPDAATWEGNYSAGNGSALLVDGQFWYWYVGGPKDLPRLGLARWPDGRRFTKERDPVLEPGPTGSWDERGVADPYVIRSGAYFYLFYLGQNRARRQRLGVARSTDGIRFEKLRTNPILEIGDDGSFDEQGLGEPAVWQSMGWYWMLYTGRDREERRRMGLAQSRDGVQWRKMPHVFAGHEAWNAEVVCDPEVDGGASAINVWFGGGNVRSPDENLNGQIGAGTLLPVSDAAIGK
jgi:predicted GH43/DUF377 family glycosyl hydrolase